MYNADTEAGRIYQSSTPFILLKLIDKWSAPLSFNPRNPMMDDALFIKMGFWETRYLTGTYDEAMKTSA